MGSGNIGWATTREVRKEAVRMIGSTSAIGLIVIIGSTFYFLVAEVRNHGAAALPYVILLGSLLVYLLVNVWRVHRAGEGSHVTNAGSRGNSVPPRPLAGGRGPGRQGDRGRGGSE